MENKGSNIFETKDVDLAAFLMFEGIKFLECCEVDNKGYGRLIVKLRFLDDRQTCRDLERVFMGSDFKKFRDLNKYLLKEVHNKLRELK